MFIQTKSPQITGVATFTILYTLAFSVLALKLQSYDSLPYLVIQFFLIALVYVAHRRTNYPLSLLWSLSALGAFLIAGGLVPLSLLDGSLERGSTLNDLWIYREWFSYNSCAHLYGLAVVTWVSWQTLCNIIHVRYQRRLMPSGGLLLLIVTSAIGYGAIGESVVQLSDYLLDSEYVSNMTKIGENMIANTLGAIISALVIKVRNI